MLPAYWIPVLCVPKSLTYCLTNSLLLIVLTTLVTLEWKAEGPTKSHLRGGLRKNAAGWCPPAGHEYSTRMSIPSFGYPLSVRSSSIHMMCLLGDLSYKHVPDLSTCHARTPLPASSCILHQPTQSDIPVSQTLISSSEGRFLVSIWLSILKFKT